MHGRPVRAALPLAHTDDHRSPTRAPPRSGAGPASLRSGAGGGGAGGGEGGVIDYIRDGAEIYRRSFATIREEADLDGLDPILARVVVRMIHACGMTDLVSDVQTSPGFSL